LPRFPATGCGNLEVLDRERNKTFRDTTSICVDLSRLVRETGELGDTIPGPLRDRMEIIRLAGYSEEEKVETAAVPGSASVEADWLTEQVVLAQRLALTQDCLAYTAGSGCSRLQQLIGRAIRRVGAEIASRRSSIS